MTINEKILLAVACFIVIFGGALLALNYWNIRRERKAAAVCVHRWRVVAAPYAKQCKYCGKAEFFPDENGDFPDGMEEYFEMMRGRKS